MSYTSTVERKRRRKMYRGGNDFTTENVFFGQASSGSLCVKEWSHKNDIDVGVSVHADKESVVEAKSLRGSRDGIDYDFVTVGVSALTDYEVQMSPEAILFVSVEQARSLRDSLNALDI